MPKSVLVIGAGIAGLTAALELAERGYAVTVLEREPRIGGRLAAVPHLPLLIMGWHAATRRLLARLGTAEHVSWPPSLALEFARPDGGASRLRRVPLPMPFHAISAILLFRGLPWQDRWRLLMWLERTWEADPPLPEDLDSRRAGEWLASIGQSAASIERIWTPLCRWLTGDAPQAVSAAVFTTVLSQSLLSGASAWKLGVATVSADTLVFVPLAARLAAAGATMRLGESVSLLRLDAQRVTGAALPSGEQLAADYYVTALPHHALGPLLPERAVTRFSYFQQLGSLQDLPAVAVTLELELHAPPPRLLLRQPTPADPFQWSMLSARPDGHAAFTCVAVGDTPLVGRSDDDVIEQAAHARGTLGATVSHAKILGAQVGRIERAFLALPPGISALRPIQASPFSNLFLAGDWTDTGLPAALEGAILSGERCAEAIFTKR